MKTPTYLYRMSLLLSLGFSGLAPVQATIHSNDAAHIKELQARNSTKTLDAKQKEELVSRFQQIAKREKYPADIIALVTPETVLDALRSYPQHGYQEIYTLYVGDGLGIELYLMTDKKYQLTLWRYDVKEGDLVTPLIKTSKINPVTKKPYFTLPADLLAKAEKPEYLEMLHQILSENFASMMPFYHIPPKAYSSGAMIGKMISPRLFYWGKQLQFVNGDTKGDERAIREHLGYLGYDLVKMCQYDKIYCLSNQFDPDSPLQWEQLYFHPGGTVHDIYCIRSTKNYADADATFVQGQMKMKNFFFQNLQSGFHAIMKSHGVAAGTDPDKAGLTADQQILAAWGNALDHYYLRLSASGSLTNMPPSERVKTKTQATWVGKETTRPVEAKDKEAAKDLEDKLKRKRAAEYERLRKAILRE